MLLASAVMMMGSANAFAPTAHTSVARPALAAAPAVSMNLGVAAANLMDKLPTTILAAEEIRKSIKSEEDELLDTFFENFPFLFTALAFAAVFYVTVVDISDD